MKEAVAAHLGVDPVDICLIRAICNYFTGATGLCLAEVDGVDYRKSFSNWCKGEMKSVESRRIFHCYAIPSSYWSHEASVQLLDEELNKLQGRLRMIYGDDPCIGVHLRQLLLDGDNLPSLTLDDFDNRVFAMEPSCHHNLWSKMTNRTWAIHHVSPEQIRCMWSADLAAAYYQESQEAEGLRVDEDRELNAFPDLCGCATDESFFERSDLDKLQAETNRILEDEEE